MKRANPCPADCSLCHKGLARSLAFCSAPWRCARRRHAPWPCRNGIATGTRCERNKW